MSIFDPGVLDDRIGLEKKVFVADDLGGATHTWTNQRSVWARVRALTGGERAANQMLAADGGYQIVIHNPTDLGIDESWRVVWNGRALNIRHIEDNGDRPIYLIMECEKGVPT